MDSRGCAKSSNRAKIADFAVLSAIASMIRCWVRPEFAGPNPRPRKQLKLRVMPILHRRSLTQGRFSRGKLATRREPLVSPAACGVQKTRRSDLMRPARGSQGVSQPDPAATDVDIYGHSWALSERREWPKCVAGTCVSAGRNWLFGPSGQGDPSHRTVGKRGLIRRQIQKIPQFLAVECIDSLTRTAF